MQIKQLFFEPHPALSGLINNYMIGHIISDTSKPKLSFPFPPLPEHMILFYPYDLPTAEDPFTNKRETLYRCTVSGPHTARNNLSFGYNHLVIKIGFQPGGLHRLTGIMMGEMLKYKDYNGADVFGTAIEPVIDALANAASFLDMKTIAENFILAQSIKQKKAVSIDHIIPEILKSGGIVKINQLAKNACMSNRQFERLFKDRIGLSPKFYSRLVRFGKAWLLKENNPSKSWTEIAYDCNYFDQMHMIHDFKLFAGTNPKIISDSLEKQPFSLNNQIFH